MRKATSNGKPSKRRAKQRTRSSRRYERPKTQFCNSATLVSVPQLVTPSSQVALSGSDVCVEFFIIIILPPQDFVP